jgi:hypothetical protein
LRGLLDVGVIELRELGFMEAGGEGLLSPAPERYTTMGNGIDKYSGEHC